MDTDEGLTFVCETDERFADLAGALVREGKIGFCFKQLCTVTFNL